MKDSEKRAREELARKRYKGHGDTSGHRVAFNVTKKGGQNVDDATWGGTHKSSKAQSIADSIRMLRKKK